MKIHLQNLAYLRARECKLAEDLIRVIKGYDEEALEAAIAENRAALQNCDIAVRDLVHKLKLSGKARKQRTAKPKPTQPKPVTYRNGFEWNTLEKLRISDDKRDTN